MKTCSKCGGESDSSGAWCKPCKNKYSKKHRETNREKLIEYARKYREENQEKIKKGRKKFNDNNKIKVNEWVKNWRDRNSEKFKKVRKNYRERHKEKIKEKRRIDTKYCVDSYISALLNKRLKIKFRPPPELIEAKRLQVLINRQLKEN